MNKKSFSENAGIHQDDFIKISLSPDNKLVPDLHNNLPGKSVWVPANKDRIKDILKGDELKTQFRVQELSTKGLIFLIEKLLRKKILNSISLTKKAGYLAIGLDTIKTQLIRKKHCLVVVAKDAKSLKKKSYTAVSLSHHVQLRPDHQLLPSRLLSRQSCTLQIRHRVEHQ